MKRELFYIYKVQGIDGWVAETVDGVGEGDGLKNVVEEDIVSQIEQGGGHHEDEQSEAWLVPTVMQAQCK